MAYTREALLLRWNGSATTRAFQVQRKGFAGENKTRPATRARSVSTGNPMQRVFGTKKRRFAGSIVGYAADSAHLPSGTVEGFSYGTVTELKTALESTDLEVKSFGDGSFWDGEPMMGWTEEAFDGVGDIVLVAAQIEEL